MTTHSLRADGNDAKVESKRVLSAHSKPHASSMKSASPKPAAHTSTGRSGAFSDHLLLRQGRTRLSSVSVMGVIPELASRSSCVPMRLNVLPEAKSRTNESEASRQPLWRPRDWRSASQEALSALSDKETRDVCQDDVPPCWHGDNGWKRCERTGFNEPVIGSCESPRSRG